MLEWGYTCRPPDIYDVVLADYCLGSVKYGRRIHSDNGSLSDLCAAPPR